MHSSSSLWCDDRMGLQLPWHMLALGSCSIEQPPIYLDSVGSVMQRQQFMWTDVRQTQVLATPSKQLVLCRQCGMLLVVQWLSSVSAAAVVSLSSVLSTYTQQQCNYTIAGVMVIHAAQQFQAIGTGASSPYPHSTTSMPANLGKQPPTSSVCST
eukprot:GHUV01015985.1.p2 GENE.GHUV01015985.1~~GHUV01015985.1.p2  ORF type:complete len:155 (+),score=39.47 GHUV01015985.1:1048-1512(+)